MEIIFNEIYSNNPNSSYSGGQHKSREELRHTVMGDARNYFRKTYNVPSWDDAQVDKALSTPGTRINIYKPDGVTVEGSVDAGQWITQQTERGFNTQRYLALRTSWSILSGRENTEADINEMSQAFRGSLTSATSNLVGNLTSGNFNVLSVITGALGGLASAVVGLIPGVKQFLKTAGIWVLSKVNAMGNSNAKSVGWGEAWALAGAQMDGDRIHSQTGNVFDKTRLNTALANALNPATETHAASNPQWNGALTNPWSSQPAPVPGSAPLVAIGAAIPPGTIPPIVIPAPGSPVAVVPPSTGTAPGGLPPAPRPTPPGSPPPLTLGGRE